MQEVLNQLFNSAPLPYKYCRIPYPDEPSIIRKKKRVYYVNHVISNLTQSAFKHAGFKQTTKSKAFNASWGRQYDNDKFAACKSWQKVNHFCGAWLIGRKDQLHKRLTELRKRTGEAAFFYPESYLIPAEKEALKRAWKKTRYWISKPVADSNGRGIKVLDSEESAPPQKKEVIVQHYIMNPLLITGRKFDMRLYVLVTSVSPFRIYMHKSGLARFATHQYDPSKSVKDLHMHLTNYSVNKKDDSFVRSDNDKEQVENSKWSFGFLLEYLEQIGIDSAKVMADLERVTVMTILSGLVEIRGFHSRHVLHRHTSYELYGIDLMLDSDLRPHVIEVNISPSLVAKDSQLDWDLKYPMVLDLLRTARIIDCCPKRDDPCPGATLVDKKYRMSLANGRKSTVEAGLVDPWKNPVFADFTMVRDFLEEKERLGGFRRVYPRRETMHEYDTCFDSMRYDDLVFQKWISMSDSERVSVIEKNFESYRTEINELGTRLKSPR